MADFHHNVFYFYRGAKNKAKDNVLLDDKQQDEQLENNTTKALINTLEYSSPKVIGAFLEMLQIKMNGEVNYLLQKNTIGEKRLARSPRRILLGVAPEKESVTLQVISAATPSSKSVPDAWIYGDDFAILIENKVVGTFDIDQLSRHYCTLSIDNLPEPEFYQFTWAEIHAFFAQLKEPHSLNSHDGFLVTQLVQYLEWNKMSGFTGFTDEHFDYFYTCTDPEVRSWVKGSMNAFARRVLEKMNQFDPKFYQGFDIGNLSGTADHCWVAFGPKENKYREYAHQSLAIDSQQLKAFINIELKRPTEYLRKKLQQPDNQAEFKRLIQDFSSSGPFYIEIRERHAFRPRKFDNPIYVRMDGAYFNQASTNGQDYYSYLFDQMHKFPLFEMAIVKSFPRSKVVSISRINQGGQFVDDVIEVMQKFHKIIQFCNPLLL